MSSNQAKSTTAIQDCSQIPIAILAFQILRSKFSKNFLSKPADRQPTNQSTQKETLQRQ